MKKLVSLFLALVMALSIACLGHADDEAPYEFSLRTNVGDLTENDTIWLANLEEKLNIKIKLILPASSAYVESLQIMIASGEYDDLVLYNNGVKDPTYKEAVKNGLYIAVNDLLPNYPNLLQYTNPAEFDELKILGDDRIYGVPRTTVNRADGFAIRKDWLDNLGIPFPEDGYLTTDELYDILYAFTFKDPDGNGQNDTYGFTHYGNIAPVFQFTFGLVGWQDYDGEYMDLKYSKTADNYKRCLAFNNKLWMDGLFDPDWPTINSSVMIDRLDSGVTGMCQRFAGHTSTDVIKGKSLNPNYELGYIFGVVESREDIDSYCGSMFSTGSWGIWAISSQAEHPEKIMEFLDYLISDEGWWETQSGPEGVAWNWVDGERVATDKYDSGIKSRNFGRRFGDASFFVHINTDKELRELTVSRIQKCVDNCIDSLDYGYVPSISDDPVFIDYNKYMTTEISKIITGARPVDDWDEILEGWYQAGGDQYIAEMQAHIAESQGK